MRPTRLLPPGVRPASLLVVLLVVLLAVPAGASGDADPGYAVVGGGPAPEDGYPSVVAVLRAEEPDDVLAQRCGGTAVADDLVLTAAHCLHDAEVRTWRTAEQLRVVAGRTDLSRDGGVELPVTDLYVHPAYDARRRRHDVALLRVGGSLGVPVQQLARPEDPAPAADDAVTVVGWGRTGPSPEESSASTAVLHHAAVPVTEPATCLAAFDGALDLLAHLCAGGAGTEETPAADTCRGDSGGPLLAADERTGAMVQHGITSYGPTRCGVGEPGVYTRLVTALPFVDAVLAGAVAPSAVPVGPVLADGPGLVRIAAGTGATDPVAQAVAASRAAFEAGVAELAVVARADGFADALAGSALSHGHGPLLFTRPAGPLHRDTSEELRRVLPPGRTVYLLGGALAVPEVAEAELAAMGYRVVRLAGATREVTAAAVAAEVRDRHGAGDRPPQGTAVLATAGAWPDAVVAGQLGGFWGTPVLLTPADDLHPATAEALRAMDLDRVVVVGGSGAVGPAVEAAVREAAPRATVIRLAGADRVGTALAVADWHRQRLAATGTAPPGAAFAVNIRAEEAYAHLLSATPLLALTAGVLLPLEGEGGDVVRDQVLATACELGSGGVVGVAVGDTDLVAEGAAAVLADALLGRGC